MLAENTYKAGLSAGLDLRYGLSDAWSIAAELLYATRGTDVESEGMSLGGFFFTYVELPVLVRLGWPIPVLAGDRGRRPLNGYLIAGPALSYLVSAVDGDDQRPLDRDILSSFDVSVLGGAGLTWEITPQWAASFEARYDWGFIDAVPEAADGRETKNRAILLMLGISYTLAHGDADGDGVADYRDQCRNEREDRNDYKDEDGCPDANEDDDRDEILAGADECPDQAEDKNGYKDEDGCPDADDDQDGDGIVDRDDECPAQSFPYNRDLEHERRGCPPAFDRVSVERDRLVVKPPLDFGNKNAELSTEQKAALDQVAELLKKYYPDMRLRLEGHADGEGNKNFNQKLSEDRARAVANYLEAQGVVLERLVEKGFGEERPIRREEQEAGKRRNRRVELIIIESP